MKRAMCKKGVNEFLLIITIEKIWYEDNKTNPVNRFYFIRHEPNSTFLVGSTIDTTT